MHDNEPDDRDDDRIDFSALDPNRDRARFEHLVAQTTARAMQRARAPAVFSALTRWTWPLVVASAVVMAGALAVLSTAEHASVNVDHFSEWAIEGRVPQHIDLVQLAEEHR